MGLRRASLTGILVVSSLTAAAVNAESARWQQSMLPYPAVYAVAPAQDGTGIVYAAASEPASGRSGVFRSGDAGETWTLLADALPGDTATSVAVDPRDSDHVFASAARNVGGAQATRLYVSSDGGATWQLARDIPGACGSVFAFDPTRPLQIYALLRCSDQLFASGDGGETWQSRQVRLRKLGVGPAGQLYAIDYDGGIVRSADNGFDWTHVNSPPCYRDDALNDLVVDPAGRLIASTGRPRLIFVDCPGVFESLDGGQSWREISTTTFGGIVVDPSDRARLFAILLYYQVIYGGVFASLDGGENWLDLHAPAGLGGLALSATGRFLYAASNRGVYRLPVPKTRVVAPR